MRNASVGPGSRDRVLRCVAGVLRDSTRAEDLIGRYAVVFARYPRLPT